MIHFLYSSGTAGAAIRASIQQLTTSGLGQLWSDTSSSWIDADDETFTQYTNPLAEQVVGETSVQYYGSSAFANTWSGQAIIGYHDTNASNIVIETQRIFVRRGVEIDFVFALDRVQNVVPAPFMFRPSRRSDGTVAAADPITVLVSDQMLFGFDLTHLVAPGVTVASINTVAVSPTGALAVSIVGPRDAQVILSADGGQVADTWYTITCIAVLSDASQLKLSGQIHCITG